MSLDNVLEGLAGADRAELARFFSHPSMWPLDPAEADRARSLGFVAPAPPSPGSTVLLSVSDTAQRRTVWDFAYCREPRRVPMGPVAAAARLTAERLVLRDLPVVPGAVPFSGDAWRARPIHVDGAGRDSAIDGDSFGASFLVAAASAALGRPVPARIAASATLAPDGSLGTVGRVFEKATFVERYALGLDTLFVHEKQVELARSAILGDRVKVVGITSARELLRRVFPAFDEPSSLPGGWRDLDRARVAADQLFAVSLGKGSSLYAWKPLATLAALLADRLGDEASGIRAAFARQVFLRHAGADAPLAPLAGAAAAELPEPLRLSMAANVVQAAADSWSGFDDALAYGRERLPEDLSACHADHLRLRGAIGRLLAHARRHAEAADWLEATVRAWLRLWLASEASYSLCELARVRGILRDRAGLERAEEFAREMESDPATTLDSLGYVALAFGRSWALCGDPRRGLERLDAAVLSREVTRTDVQATRVRWTALALDALGDRMAAAECRRSCEEALERDGATPTDWAMVRLERALAGDGELEGDLDAARSAAPRMVAVLGADLAGRALGEALVREYPY